MGVIVESSLLKWWCITWPLSLGEITLLTGTRSARGRTHRVRWKVAPVSDSLPYKVSDSLNIEQVDSRSIAWHPPALSSMPSHPPFWCLWLIKIRIAGYCSRIWKHLCPKWSLHPSEPLASPSIQLRLPLTWPAGKMRATRFRHNLWNCQFPMAPNFLTRWQSPAALVW